MNWEFTAANNFPDNGEDEFKEYQVIAWIRPEDIYFDFLDKAILDNGVEIIPTK